MRIAILDDVHDARAATDGVRRLREGGVLRIYAGSLGSPGALARGPMQEYALLRRPFRTVEPFLVLVALPIAIGALAEAAFRDAKRASFAAALGTGLSVPFAVHLFDRDESWSWLAAVLVWPLPVALAIGTVLFWYGRTTAPPHRPPHGA